MKVVVVDDEAPARRRLIRLLEAIEGVTVVGEADHAASALDAVKRLRPDLLLLDIEMPGLSGMELASRHADLPPVIFVTAHESHALRAFEVAAVDYLLKPVRPERLAAAIARARGRTAVRALDPPDPSRQDRIVTRDGDSVLLVDAARVARFHASEKYTVFQVDGVEHLTEEPLSTLATRLADLGFRRVHRAELVRLSGIRALHGDERGHHVMLRDGQVARVSRRLVASLRRELGL